MERQQDRDRLSWYREGRFFHRTQIYALGKSDDPRFTEQLKKQWDKFCVALIDNNDQSAPIPGLLTLDAKTLLDWYKRGLLDKELKVWNLTSK